MKINCPYHDDKTASMHLYADHAHCFGCGKHVTLATLEEEHSVVSSTWVGKPGSSYYPFKAKHGRQENVAKSLERINTLPRKLIRGFELPYDDKGYYIVYPNSNYYVLRLWEGDNTNKYRSPLGHRKSLFTPSLSKWCDDLIVVEGQINALTAALCVPGVNIVSAGACTDLNRGDFVKYYLQFSKICIIVDKDAAGVSAGVELKKQLVNAGKRVVLFPMEQDINDVYVNKGEAGVKQKVSEAMGMF